MEPFSTKFPGYSFKFDYSRKKHTKRRVPSIISLIQKKEELSHDRPSCPSNYNGSGRAREAGITQRHSRSRPGKHDQKSQPGSWSGDLQPGIADPG
jgi:hypothetical protein